MKVCYKGKKVTYILTSMKLGDEITIGYVEQVVKSSGGTFLSPISLLDEDILNPLSQATVCHWYNYIKDCVENSVIKITNDVTVSIVDVGEYNNSIVRIIQQLEKQYIHYGVKVKKVALRDYVIKPCTACYFCYSGRECCIQDAQKKSCEDIYTNSNLILFVGKIKYGMYSQIYKTWLDRHVHRIAVTDSLEDTNVNPEASEIVTEIEAEQQELKAKANQLEEMNTGIKQLNGVISSMQSSKPRLITLWLNQCWLNVLVGWIVIYFIQPFYLKKVMKKYRIIQ